MKRFLLLWSLLSAVLMTVSLSCMYEPLILDVPPPGSTPPETPPPETASGSGAPGQKYWVSTGIVIRTDVPGSPVATLRSVWSGRILFPSPVPPETPPPMELPWSGTWTEALSGDSRFTNLAAGDTADLYREQAPTSDLRPGGWDFSFSIWEDGCPVRVACRQEIFGRLDPRDPDEPLTPAAELTVNRNGCIATSGALGTPSVDNSPRLANNAAIAPIGDYRTGAAPCRWKELWGAANEWTVAVDNATGKRGLTLASASADRRLLAWDYIPPADAMEILAKVRPGADRGAAVCGRATDAPGAAADNALCAGLVGGTDLQVGRVVAGSDNLLFTRTFPYGNGSWWIRFRVEGNTVRAKAWADNTLDPSLANEPGWMIDNTLPAGPPPTPGLAGIAAASASGGLGVEWFSVGLRGDPAPGPGASAIGAPRPPAPRPAARPRALPRRPAPAR